MKKLIILALAALTLFGAVGAGAPPEEPAETPAAESAGSPTPGTSPTPTASPIPDSLAALSGEYRFAEPATVTAILRIDREGEKMSFVLLSGGVAVARGAASGGEGTRLRLRGVDVSGKPLFASLEPVADTLNYTLTVRFFSQSRFLPAGGLFRLRRTDIPEGLEPYRGEYRADGDDNPAPASLTIGADGAIVLGIERLTEFRGYVDSIRPDAVMLSARDPNGETIAFEFGERNGEYRLRVTDSAWMLLPAGEAFRFKAAPDEPGDGEPTAAPETEHAVPRGYEGFVGRYTASHPGPAELTIQADGGFLLDIQRLCVIRGAVRSVKEGFLVLNGLDPNGNAMELSFGNKFNEYELHVTDSAWSLLPSGEVFGFGREPTPPTAPAPIQEPDPTPGSGEAVSTPEPTEGPAADPSGENVSPAPEKTGAAPVWPYVLALLCAGAAALFAVFQRKKKDRK